MGKCSTCGSDEVPQIDPTDGRPNGASNSCTREGYEQTGIPAPSGLSTLDAEDTDQLKRSVVALSEKWKLAQEGLQILGENVESSTTRCKEREKIVRDLASLHEEHSKAVAALQNTIAVQNVQIAELTMQLRELETRSCDGILLWKISDYRNRKNVAATKGPASFYSDSFYTSRLGYKMCARVYLNGDGIGKGTHLSVFFVVKKGNNDAFLRWPFQQRVTFRLMNQGGGQHAEESFRPDPESSSFSRPQKDMNIASGCPLFVSHQVLENPQKGFLKDDTIYIQVKVDVSNL